MIPTVRNTVAWILWVLLAVAFIFSGFAMLIHGPDSVKMFGSMELPGWFAYLIGGAELLGEIGLLLPRTVRLAALGLLLFMVGAVTPPATRIPGGLAKGVPAIALLAGVLWLRHPAAQVGPNR